MISYRNPSNNSKRKKPLKPTFKSTWTIEKILDILIKECNESVKIEGIFRFCAEDISEKYKAKIEIVRAAIQKFRLNIPEGFRISEFNTSPHESSRNNIFWNGGKGGWRATWYTVKKVFKEQ